MVSTDLNGLMCKGISPLGHQASWLSGAPVSLEEKSEGIVRSRAWAVLRLMTSSHGAGCSIGRSAGVGPFRILSTSLAARRRL
jgi:hypothetical protein